MEFHAVGGWRGGLRLAEGMKGRLIVGKTEKGFTGDLRRSYRGASGEKRRGFIPFCPGSGPRCLGFDLDSLHCLSTLSNPVASHSSKVNDFAHVASDTELRDAHSLNDSPMAAIQKGTKKAR